MTSGRIRPDRARVSGEPGADRSPGSARELERIRRLSRWADAAWRIPGTRIRFGFDALVGLVPGVGDLAGAGLSAYLIWRSRRLGMPRSVLARMWGNVAIEALVGTVPLAGDVFDVGFKANLRNVRLLEDELDRRARATATARS